MGRNSERLRQQLRLEVKAPSFFRCPISLEVMRSPVSLCTGVTYDRSSIQRWLDSGNTTCPATMLPLPTTDLIPNLTLRRLIGIWSSSSSSSSSSSLLPNKEKDAYAPADLLRDIKTSADPVPLLEKLADFFLDDEIDESVKNDVINAGDCASALIFVLNGKAELKTIEAAIKVISLIFNLNCIEDGNKEITISAILSNLQGSVSSLIAVLKSGNRLGSRADSARVLEAILSASYPESKILIMEKVEELIPELIRLISPSDYGTKDRIAIDSGLGCLIRLSPSKRVRAAIVQAGAVPVLARILSHDATELPATVAEKAMKVLEAAANCPEGRAAIWDRAEECVVAVMGRMMKVGKEGREAAVGVLWSVCYGAGGDRRAREAVAGASGGMAKILVVMQGDCSPAVTRMAGDLLRVFPVDSKSLLAGYDTKTTHITPF